MIYFIQRTDKVIKIGFTDSLGERMADYRSKYRGCELLGSMQGDRAKESELHKVFADYLVEGREWFSDCPSIQAYIAANTTKGIPAGQKRCSLRLEPLTQIAVNLMTVEYQQRTGKLLSADDALWMFIQEHAPDVVDHTNRILAERYPAT